MSRYPKVRNGKLESGGLPRHHIFMEEKQELWVLCQSSLTAMGIGRYCKSAYPNYTLCLCNRETYLRLGGKI